MRQLKIKFILKLFSAPVLWVMNGCSPIGEPVDSSKSLSHYYSPNEKEILYSYKGQWSSMATGGAKKMNVDLNNFEVLNDVFSKDKARVFYYANTLNNADVDVATFYVKKDTTLSSVGFDAKHVYAYDYLNQDTGKNTRLMTVEDANPLTYQQLSDNWSKDDKNHYYRNQLIAVDYETFENIDDHYSKDKDNVYVHYFNYFHIINADVDSFEVLESNYLAMDKNHVYFLDYGSNQKETELIVIDNLEEQQVILITELYFRIGSQIYWGATPLDLNANEVKLVGTAYLKDSEHVYYANKLLPNVDAGSFELRENGSLGDKDGLIRAGERIVSQ